MRITAIDGKQSQIDRITFVIEPPLNEVTFNEMERHKEMLFGHRIQHDDGKLVLLAPRDGERLVITLQMKYQTDWLLQLAEITTRQQNEPVAKAKQLREQIIEQAAATFGVPVQ